MRSRRRKVSTAEGGGVCLRTAAIRSASSAEFGRRRSLRREWSQAFTIMLALLLVAAVATIVGVWGVVSQVQSTATLLHRESVTVAALRSDLVAHEQVAHKLLSDDQTVNRAAFIAQQDVDLGRVHPGVGGVRE